MMISEKMNEQLNQQITNELFASQAYLAVACLADDYNLKNLASVMRDQSSEERDHAMKFVDYILDQDGKVQLATIEAPPQNHVDIPAAIQFVYDHEKRVTKQIHDLAALAEEERDFATRQFLNWFIEEQVEEVSSMRDLLDAAKMCGPHLLNLEAYLLHLKKS